MFTIPPALDKLSEKDFEWKNLTSFRVLVFTYFMRRLSVAKSDIEELTEISNSHLKRSGKNSS